MSEIREERQWRAFTRVLKKILKTPGSRYDSLKNYIQHGSTSVYRHSISVAFQSFCFARNHHIKVDYESLIVGALLHDYFLYDWHVKEKGRPLHGFYHPIKALSNASEDFRLNEKERDIISHHMFPLTPIPPKCREAWIVCMVDKAVSARETVNRTSTRRKKHI